jgi:hypothetical protein
MPKLVVVSDNEYRKEVTGADYNRPSGVLKDKLIIVSANQELTRIISVGFIYTIGTYELEVYINGVLKRPLEYVNGVQYGDYSELTNATVQFEAGIISENDQVRFRVTSAYYRATISSGGSGGGSVSPYASKIIRQEIAPGDWSSSGILYFVNIDISNIGYKYVNVECWNNATDKIFAPLDIESISVNQLRIWMPINTMTITVVVTG